MLLYGIVEYTRRMSDYNPLKEKVLLLLYAGVSLGFAYTPDRQFRVFRELGKEWGRIDGKVFREKLTELHRSGIVRVRENPDGTYEYVLTEKGKTRALTQHFQQLAIRKGVWDGKWRMVIFDIPEKVRLGRDALRNKLQKLGFHELQKSVFIFPYPCRSEIDFLVELFNMRKFVRFCEVDFIDNDLHLRKLFHLGA